MKFRRKKLLFCFLLFFCCLFLFWKPTNFLKQPSLHNNLSQPIRLFVLIITGPLNRERRDVIRSTWIADAVENDKIGDDVIFRFVIGTKDLDEDLLISLEMEASKSADLILLPDLTDKYKSLTLKLAKALDYINTNFDFDFLLKVDDDSFVRVAPLYHELRHDDVMLYWGYFYGRGRVKTAGVWKEQNWKLCDYYLPYARGGGYLLSRDIIAYIATNWRLFEMYLSEDVTIGVWTAALRINRRHDVRFDTEYKSRGCLNSFLISHKQSIDDLKMKSKNLRINGEICSKETVYFRPYEYNWSSKPSECCIRR